MWKGVVYIVCRGSGSCKRIGAASDSRCRSAWTEFKRGGHRRHVGRMGWLRREWQHLLDSRQQVILWHSTLVSFFAAVHLCRKLSRGCLAVLFSSCHACRAVAWILENQPWDCHRSYQQLCSRCEKWLRHDFAICRLYSHIHQVQVSHSVLHSSGLIFYPMITNSDPSLDIVYKEQTLKTEWAVETVIITKRHLQLEAIMKKEMKLMTIPAMLQRSDLQSATITAWGAVIATGSKR